ncbi:ABC transporter permease subunit [Clostridium niameyense]|uniref:ABC transporter permease subunit n=1 Tax=Clostridium niameyense TaxID=1622073 RepID=A0A6M0R863_9CLOT|nr:ABC transporter permease subunit [Clostridium niameyense]NEZ46425.1 ABC transporter permease subunit [Clostridium niameyense]
MKNSITKLNKDKSKLLKKFFIVLFWIIIWELCSLIINKDILLPSPFNVFKTLINLMGKRYFWISVFKSITRVIIGLIISIIFGIVLGIISGLNKFLEEFLEPLIVIIKATPVMSIIIIALVWFKSSNVALFTTILMCFPIIYTNVLLGIKSVNKDLITMSQIYRVKKIHILKDIYIPSIKQYIISGILMCLGIGWKVCVASEVLSTPRYSIGLNLFNAKATLETEELFAWTIVVVLLSFIFEMFFKHYINKKSKY